MNISFKAQGWRLPEQQFEEETKCSRPSLNQIMISYLIIKENNKHQASSNQINDHNKLELAESRRP